MIAICPSLIVPILITLTRCYPFFYCMLTVISLANHKESMGIVFHVQGIESTEPRSKNIPGVSAKQHGSSVAAVEWMRVRPVGEKIREVGGGRL